MSGADARLSGRSSSTGLMTSSYSAPLTEENIQEVARRMLKTVSARMEVYGDSFGSASEAAIVELAKEGYDPKYGARPLRRAIQSQVEDAVAEKMLDGTLREGDTAKLTVEDSKLCVSK